MSNVVDILTSGAELCRICLACGPGHSFTQIDQCQRFFDHLHLEEIEHPLCNLICDDCNLRVFEAMQLFETAIQSDYILKDALATIRNNESNTAPDPLDPDLADKPWDIKSEGADADTEWGIDIERVVKEECYSENATETTKLKKHGSGKSSNNIKEQNKEIDNDQHKFVIVQLTREQQLEEMKEMAADHKYINSVYKCSLCIRGFGFESTYKKHMVVHDSSTGRHKCDMCQVYIPKIHSYAKHISNHARRYKCAKCDYTKRTRRGVIEHYGAEHDSDKSKVNCPHCGKEFLKRSVLRQHISYRHDEKERKKCPHCDTTYRTVESLRRHMLKHVTHELPEKIKRFPCEKCGQKFLNTTLLKMHQRCHSDERNFYCKICNRFYKSEIILKWHIKYSSKHYDIDKRIPCPHCDKRLVSQRDLARHIEKDHLGIANFHCNICPRSYYTKNLLRIHIKRSHEKLKSPRVHMCDYCGKAFSMRKTLVCHINTHTGAKPFACGECEARFAHSGALYTHVKLVHRKMKRNAKGRFTISAAGKKPD